MTPKEFEALAKEKIEAFASAVEKFFEAHPDVESDAASALQLAADDASEAAKAEVEQVAPKSTQELLDDAISAVDANTAKEIAIIQAQADARKAELTSAKAAVAS